MTFIKAKTIIYIVLLTVYTQSSTIKSNSYFSFSILYLCQVQFTSGGKSPWD